MTHEVVSICSQFELLVWHSACPSFSYSPCGWDKSSDPISTVLKQEVCFQNSEHMANGCQQPGFHSFLPWKNLKYTGSAADALLDGMNYNITDLLLSN